MTAKERIRAIRLMDKACQNPDYAKRIGLSVELKKAKQIDNRKEV